MAREKVFEKLVSWIWEQQALVGPLPGDDGHTYQVVFRGRPWGERSSDFQGALIARDDGVLLRGDVEIHVRASDWDRHGHGANPTYNQTVCQVVLWQDGSPPIVRQDGTIIPTVEIVTRLAAPLIELERRAGLDGRTSLAAGPGSTPLELRAPALPCVTSAADLERLLDRAGVARFLEHAATFESDLSCLPPDEVLYRGALRAMGYTANTDGFARLGQTLPLATLRAVAAGAPRAERLQHVEAALLGVAGLLPSQRRSQTGDGLPSSLDGAEPARPDAAWPAKLESAWGAQSPVLPTPLPRGTWRAWRVRPDNVPVRRAAGMSRLICSWSGGNPMDWLLDDLAVAERRSNPALLAQRWQARVEPDEFWATHHDFGKPLAALQPWLVGAGRAGEIVVNVLLPFVYALGQATSDRALSDRALAVYQRYPSGPPNRVVKEMALQVGGVGGLKLARGACRQQGLIHLYRHWCDTRDCARCAAGPT